MDGSWCEDSEEVKKGVRLFFESKFKSQRQLRPLLVGVPFRNISEEDNHFLCSRFELGEIQEVVWGWGCANDKSHGLMDSILDSLKSSGTCLERMWLGWWRSFLSMVGGQREAMLPSLP